MRNIVVASSKAHAAAMIRWLKMDEEHWFPVAYGEKGLTGGFEYVRLIRPVGGVTDAHVQWTVEQLLPRVIINIGTLPSGWPEFERFVDAGDDEDAA